MYGDVHGLKLPPSTRQPNVTPREGSIWPGTRPRKRNWTTWSGVSAGGRAMIVVTGAGGPDAIEERHGRRVVGGSGGPPAPAGRLADPVASLVTNASSPPPLVPCSAFAVGKSAPVRPVTYASPAPSTVDAVGLVFAAAAEIRRAQERRPGAFNCVTKASSAPPLAACAGLAVGKSVDSVRPATTVRPAWSTATPPAASTLAPPR